MVSASLVAIITQVIAYYFTKKSLERQQEHSLKVMKMQLFHEDKKKALIKLDELLNADYPSFSKFTQNIRDYLKSSESIFIPLELRKKLSNRISDINSFLLKRDLEFHGVTEEELANNDQEMYEDWAKEFPEYQYDNKIRDRLSELTTSIRDEIKKYVSEEK
ncbi:MAG: hypothetical protein NUK63_00060 [Candidatus Bathyarchaeum tardum]|nr:MAG: hypothetical protein NUK63_00060 [Candidatus Bathyarchaeum tardum]